MYEIVAYGPGVNQRCCCPLSPGNPVRMGRSPREGWSVPWDLRISREHADLLLRGDRLRVRRLATARNRIYLDGQPREEFTIAPGEAFRIGQTEFRMSIVIPRQCDEPDLADSLPVTPLSRGERLDVQPVERRLRALLRKLDMESGVEETGSSWASASVESPTVPPLKGTVLANYDVGEELHRGDWSLTLKAWHRVLGREAAIVFLSAARSTPPEVVEGFLRKSAWLAGWDHPQLIRAWDAGTLDQVLYLVLEYFHGSSLHSCHQGQSLDLEAAVGTIRKAAMALAYVHRRGIVHGTLKPGDLLVDNAGGLKLTGWSTARGGAARSDDRRSTPSKAVILPRETPPALQVDPRGDVYLLGATFFSLLTGRPWPPGDSSPAPSERSLALALLRDLGGGTPLSLVEVLMRMVAVDPDERYRTMTDVLEALRLAMPE